MEITEVRIKLMEDPQDRLLGFCSITLDSCFVIRDLKIIRGTKGSFVAMPSRKLADRCPKCGCKNHLRAQYCNQCGNHLDENRADKDEDGRAKLYADIAHPINSACREMIQQRVLEAYEEERQRAQQPGYICRYDDRYDDDDVEVPDRSAEGASRVTTVASDDGNSRRIEAAEDQPGRPHHNRIAQPREKTPAGSETGSNGQRNGHGEEDSFGAGLI